jgi:hypothetical protein
LADAPKPSNATFDIDVPEIHMVESQQTPFLEMVKEKDSAELNHYWETQFLKPVKSTLLNLVNGIIVTKDIELVALLDSLPQFRRVSTSSGYTRFEKINGC